MLKIMIYEYVQFQENLLQTECQLNESWCCIFKPYCEKWDIHYFCPSLPQTQVIFTLLSPHLLRIMEAGYIPEGSVLCDNIRF
jgi:hypothetical protein